MADAVNNLTTSTEQIPEMSDNQPLLAKQKHDGEEPSSPRVVDEATKAFEARYMRDIQGYQVGEVRFWDCVVPFADVGHIIIS